MLLPLVWRDALSELASVPSSVSTALRSSLLAAATGCASFQKLNPAHSVISALRAHH
jgi:hypothetical protein